MASVAGYVEKIKYRNEENGYSILSVSGGGEEFVLVGTFPVIEEGEYIQAEGVMKVHPVYGEQLQVFVVLAVAAYLFHSSLLSVANLICDLSNLINTFPVGP